MRSQRARTVPEGGALDQIPQGRTRRGRRCGSERPAVRASAPNAAGPTMCTAGPPVRGAVAGPLFKQFANGQMKPLVPSSVRRWQIWVSIIVAGAHTIATGLPSVANRARRSRAAADELSQMTTYSCPYRRRSAPRSSSSSSGTSSRTSVAGSVIAAPYLRPGAVHLRGSRPASARRIYISGQMRAQAPISAGRI